MTTHPIAIENLLACDRFHTDEKHPHIVIDTSQCAACTSRPCLTSCPAQLYTKNLQDGSIHFDHLGCLECGTCRFVCAVMGKQGIIQWSYPKRTAGVQYRYG